MIKQFYFKQFNLTYVIYLLSVWISNRPIDRILSGATTPGQNGLERDDNEGVLHIP